jgi:lipoprotein-anchoring transpeptidase ErfK/SrfK
MNQFSRVPLAPAPRRIAVALSALSLLAAGAVPAMADVRVSLVQGEQNVTVTRPGDGLQAAMAALLAGPTPAERARQIRTYIPPRTPLRSVSQTGGVATVDLGNRIVADSATEDVTARLSQVVGTATAVPGVTSVQVLIDGGVPLGLFPGVDVTVPLTARSLQVPSERPPAPSRVPATAPTNSTRQVQARLAQLGYLLPSQVDGRGGPATTTAIIAFQKWEGLQRDGVAGAATRARLARASRPTPVGPARRGRWTEVLLDRQLVLANDGGRVVRALHVSTGAAATPTPTGTYSVYSHITRWWSVPFREWLLWASPFVGGIAFHQLSEVPVYPASHGCVRLPEATARWLWDFVSVGTTVRVIARSR